MAQLQLNKSGVLFKEDSHQYFRESDGKELSGITSVISKQLFPHEYDSVPDYVLGQAAQYGKDVHKSLELFDAQWTNDGTPELQDYISICKENNLVHVASEYLVSDGENYASSIDKVYRDSDTSYSLGDIKTYGMMTGDKLQYCRWQLSIYAYLFELQNPKAKVKNIFVIHLRNRERKDGTYEQIKDILYLNRIPTDICINLLECNLRGEQFKNPFDVPEELTSQISRIKELIIEKTKAEEELNTLKANILETMEFLDVKTWETPEVRLTRKLPTTRSSFDLKLFKSGHPEINDYDNYMKTSEIAGSLLVSVA